jgi:hypothetical protein
MDSDRQKGQAILLVLAAVGLVMAGGMGLAVDTSNLYFHRQMAQAAADAAATAAALSIFQGVNVSTNAGYFATSATFTCAVSDTKVPCKYAAFHGFGGTTDDTITVSFPTSATGVSSPSSSFSPNLIRVSVRRQVSNSFMRLLGAPAKSAVTAAAVAGIVDVASAVPILVLHPHKSDALAMNGTTDIKICGGPTRSIQVNSDNASAYAGGGSIDLSKAGPGTTTSSDCMTPHGNGADFGVFGGRTTDPGSISYGSTPGRYLQPSSPLPDPLLSVSAPSKPSTTIADENTLPTTTNTNGCDTTIDSKGCRLYTPGTYTNGISIKNKTGLFAPGIYYMDNSNGFSIGANGAARMCTGTGCGASSDPNISDGMLVYNKWTSGGAPTFSVTSNADKVVLKGTPQSGTWKGVLFFQDHNSPAATHILGGGGCLQLEGTLYTTNTVSTILASSGFNQYQTIEYHGNPCSSTYVLGEIITDSLTLKGTSNLQMLLQSQAYLTIPQVALLN